jgi:hypothetical protein
MFADDQIIRERNLGIGDEVLITGLYTQTPESTMNISLVHMGSVATAMGENLPFKDGTMEAYLVESRSIDGLSGSPVFVRETRQIQSLIPLKTGKFPNQTVDSCSDEMAEIETVYGVGRVYFSGSLIAQCDLEHFAAVPGKAMNVGAYPVVPAQKIKEVLLQIGLIELMKSRSERLIQDSKRCATYD